MRKLIILFCIICVSSITKATIINVPADIDSIQGGINLANPGDTVLVQPGTYVENINFNGKNIVVGSLTLTTEDTSYISQTIIEDSSGIKVTFENGEDSTAVLNGFSIKGIGPYNGGGILVINSSPSISYLHINNNHNAGGGGGLHLDNSNAQISHIKVESNSTGSPGGPGKVGGIYCDNSNPVFSDVQINSNKGGMLLENSNPILINGEIIDNYERGGIQCYSSNPLLDSVSIVGNSRGIGSSGEVEKGAGMYLSNSKPVLFNVEITENISQYYGGIYCDHSDLILINSTISNNYQDNDLFPYEPQANSVFCKVSNLILINSISWFNEWKEIAAQDTSSITILHSDVQGGLDSILAYTDSTSTVNWLTGNIGADPMFVDTANGDYELLPGSPCIDAGIQDTMIVYNNGFDTLIVPPITYIGYAPDMGVYEYNPFSTIKSKPDKNIPDEIYLNQNYPNPFNPKTTIEFSIPKTKFITLKIYNLLGEEIATLVSKNLKTGNYKYDWDASNFASGIYFYRLETEHGVVQSKKLILLK